MKTLLNSSEKEMFLAQTANPESSQYCLLLGIRFRGVAPESLVEAFEKVAAATPVFRSHYALENGEPVRIDDGVIPEVEICDASDFDAVCHAMAALPHQRNLSVTPIKAVVYRLATESVIGISCHHIVFDGASSALLVKSIESVLAGGEPLAQPTDNVLPMPPDSAFTLYDEMFAFGVPSAEMPLRGARSKVHPFEDQEMIVSWSSNEFASVVETAHRLSVTAFELIFSAVGAVVAKYCGSEDVVLGTQVNSRDDAHKNAIGMFVNTGVVRLQPKREMNFEEYVKATAVCVRRVNHGEVLPFSDVLARYGVQADASRNPMFDIAVNWLPPQPEQIYRVPSKESGAEKRARDLTLTFTRTKTDLSLLISWPSELFDENLVANFAEQLKSTLVLAAQSKSPLSVREVLELPENQRKILADFSQTAVAESEESLLHKMFEKTAQANPSKTALVAVDRSLTFAELDAEADAVAANLQAKGVGRGDSIVLLLPRESLFFSAMFGVLKAGATFIPCDPKYPADRINGIIADSDAKYIVTTADRLGDYPKDKTLDVGSLCRGGGKPSDSGVTGDDLAYMIYTSGSTGKPKGVMLRHAGICNYLRPHPANIHMDIVSREVTAYVSVTTVSFDMSFKEHCGALVNGKTLVFAGDDQMNDPEELAKLIVSNNADAINATPSRLLQYLECEAFRRSLGGMKVVLSGGEMYPFALRDQLKAVTKAKFYNTYGPTEITVSSNVSDLTDAAYVHVGRPLLNYREWIVDKFGDLCPFGVTGELWVGGIGVAKGYRNLPEQTKARFITYQGMPVYKTGDMARWDLNGNVLIYGRMDSQVKLRGLRIELGEVEGLLAQQPGVKSAAVVVRKLDGQENLCAYYVADKKIDPAALRDELKKSLTSYMVPTAYLQMETFPVTPNGKTDLKALPDAVRLVEDLALPETECQRKIFEVVAGVIGHRNFGIRTSFMSAGLSSLGVVKLSVSLEKAFGLPFRIRDILANDTIVKLEGYLALAALASFQSISGEKAPVSQKDYPITKTQMGIFIECQGNPDTTIYNIPRLLKLGDGIDMNRLVAALKSTVDAHPYIKTHLFQNTDGDVRAERRDEAEAKVMVVEGALPEPQSLVKPYNLLGDDLYRIAIYKTTGANYLFVEFHHIVSDGESDGIFFRDLNRAYAGEMLESETFTGFEVALDEEAALKTDAFKKAKQHYDAIFAGCEPDTVPEDFSAEGVARLGRAKHMCAVSATAIKSFCDANGTSVNAFFNTAFGLMLSRYSNVSDAVYTTVYNGRSDSRTISSMSMFVKTLPILFHRADDQKIADAVQKMNRQIIGAMENDLFSFAEAAQTYGVKADILFVYQGEGFAVNQIGGEPCECIPVEFDHAKAKLQIEVGCTGDDFVLAVEYDEAFYTAKFISGLLESFETVLVEFLEKSTIGDVDLCSDSCRKSMDAFFGPVVPYDREKTVVELFREQAKESPDHPCIVYLNTMLTYREVDEKSDRIAAFLATKGIGKGDFVSILIPRCVWMTTASLGVLKSGAAYQPLDPSYPPERLEFMIADAGAKLVIADESLLDRIPGYKGPVVTLVELEKLPKASLPATCAPNPSDAFIILYTSGSTGKPKGAVLEHGNLMAFCDFHCRGRKIDASSRSAAYASYGFDANMMDQYPVLTAGGTLHILDESIRLDLAKIDEYFCANGITHAFMTTQVGRQYAQVATAKTLKWLGVGGEALVPLDPPKAFELYNLYGPTETTIYITGQTVERFYKHMPIGKAVDNMRAYVVDDHGRRVPPGVPGELWVAGPQVSRGYLNNPEKTAAVFSSNPFAQADGDYARVYKTGDIVKFQPDGTIMFVGRRDGQVKVRGFRIELSEVEEVVRRFPGVKDATVEAFDDPAGGKFIAAYVVGDEKIDIAALHAFIGAEKPPYMVPAVTMQIEKIPLNQNQKVNKRALPKPERKIEDMVLPETDSQKQLFEIVADVLGHRDFGITTSLKSVGLSSIGVIKLSAALGKAFGLSFKIGEILEYDTVLGLETFIASAALAFVRTSVTTQTKTVLKDYPITKTQMGIFVESQMHLDTTIYNIPRLLKLGSSVDVSRLKKALVATVNAHPYLKTHLFQNADGDVRARRRDDAEVKISVIDGPLPEPQSLVKPYDLLGDDLYRIAIYRTAEANYLFIDVNHIVSDGESDAIFLRDLNRSYAGKTLACETYSGFEAALDEESALKSGDFEKAKAHYESLFAGCEPECQPAFDTEIGEAGAGHFVGSLVVPIESVYAFCRKKGVSVNALLNTVFAFVLAKYSGRRDAIYTTIYNGRSDSRMANSIAMFVKTLPVWCDFKDEFRIDDVVKGMGEQLVACMANDLFSFADVAKTYGVRSDVMFVYQGEVSDGNSLCGEPCESIALSLNQSKALIDFQVMIKNGRFEYFCEYDRVNYSEWLIKGFAECFGNTLAEFLVKETLGDVAVCSEAQLERLDKLNDTTVVYDGPKTVVGLFRRSVEQYPDNIAVVHLDKKFTYRQVDEMSDRIAAYLRSKGIGKEDLVAVLIPRCEYMTIASLGVSKAGAAYQPLDPSYPPERLAYMVGDTQAKLLIADESLLDRLPDYKGEILLTKDIPSLPDVSARRDEILSWSPNPEDAFIILYTSGSTGKPKGAILEHRCLVNFCNWYPRYFNMGSDAHVAAYASYGFDACMMDMYPTLTVGATIYIVDDSIRLDLDQINAYFTEVGITHSFMTTQVCRQFAQVTNAPSLQHLTASGEKLVPIAPPEGYKFYNGGGPTECTIYVAAFQVEKMYRRVPLGYPLANLRAYVVDERGRRLPPGMPGELWVSSVQISRHYLNNPEKTAAAYGVNPFTQEDGYKRIYRTGDICRIQEDGLIDILGRRDGMVKVRGFRIELSEVEEVVRRFPGVKDATVQAYDSPAGGKYICAYIVGDGKIDVEAMNAFILAEKPPYLVPAVTMQIDEIPLNQNQKVDKRKLPKPQAQRSAYVAPETPAEKAFCEAMGQLLAIEQVSATDDFFDIGGSSISAIALMAKANAAGYPVTYANVFALRTPRALAEIVSGGAKAPAKEMSNPLNIDFNVYDHEAIKRLLSENTLENFNAGERQEIGDALFTGATGFMGIHLLARFLDTEKGKAYCLVRHGKQMSAERRLKNLLYYYFDDRYDTAFADRIEVFDGDVTKPETLEPIYARKVDTVFNCAANVKHFSSGTDIEDINIGGAKTMVEFCLKSGARLVHFSTESVHGHVPAKDGLPTLIFDEQTAYAGQNLASKYTVSKMIAELEVFKAVVENGLRAKVIRLGLLSPRERDGEFQINFRTNAFMGTLRAYATLGSYPYSRLAESYATDPIDCGVAAYLALARTPEKCRLFHATNYDTVPMGSIIRMMNAEGVKVDFVEDDSYNANLDKALADSANARIFQPLLAYRGMTGDSSLVAAKLDNSYTVQVLARLGFFWKAIGEDYIENFVKRLKGLGFFE